MLPSSMVQGLLIAAMLSAPVSHGRDSLQATADRICSALIASDWAKFRRDAVSNLSVEEHWRAYEDYFDKKAWTHRPNEGMLGVHDDGFISCFTTIENVPRLSILDSRVFRKFCTIVKDSKETYSSSSRDWPTLNSLRSVDPGLYLFPGPSCTGKVASNLAWAAIFERSSGKWKVQRLILVGH